MFGKNYCFDTELLLFIKFYYKLPKIISVFSVFAVL